MKKSLMLSACMAALLASPALAGTNTSSVTQAGTQQTATINQTGNNDQSTTDQKNSANTILVNQSGKTGNASLVKQSGTIGSATVTQTDDGSGTKPVANSTIDQQGGTDVATVDQFSQNSIGQNVSAITQVGSFNTAGVIQRSSGQTSSITQNSNNNSALVLQGDALLPSNTGNTTTLVQGGTGSNIAEVHQEQGTTGTATISSWVIPESLTSCSSTVRATWRRSTSRA